MFTEEDLEATPVLVGSNSEPIILDRFNPSPVTEMMNFSQ